MPQQGMCWRHIVISTLNSWLPGDERGFRSRGGKIHSSGDYKNPPPKGEHAGLHRHSQRISSEPIVIPKFLRQSIGEALIESLNDHQLLVLSVGGMHAHVLIELPDDIKLIKRIVGGAKNLASRRVRKHMPGRIWAASGGFKRVDCQMHQRRVYKYILDHYFEGAWVWEFREGVWTGEK